MGLPRWEPPDEDVVSEAAYLKARIQSLTQAIAATTSLRLKAAWKLDLDATSARLAELAAPAPATTATGLGFGFAPGNMPLWETDTDLARGLDLAAATGAKWWRFDFDWQSTEPLKGAYQWRYIDRVVDGCRSRGLTVLGTIAYTPAWARPSNTTDKTPPTTLADYVSFASACVKRYAPIGVHAWEVWNEPNIQFWMPKPDPARYTDLLRQTYAAIKQLDPSATVVSAGLAPAGDSADGQYVSPRTFITKMYAAGAKGSFDALGMHPYAYPYGITALGDWNQWQSMDKTAAVLAANGDTAKIWATEYGAPTGTVAGRSVTEAQQAQFVVDAAADWSKRPYAGPLLWYSLRDSGTNQADTEQMFGLVRRDFTTKPAYAAFATLPKT